MILISHNTQTKKKISYAQKGKKKGTTHLDEDDDVRDDARDRSCSEKKTREREINSRQRALFRKTRKNILVRAKREKRKRDKNADTFCPL